MNVPQNPGSLNENQDVPAAPGAAPTCSCQQGSGTSSAQQYIYAIGKIDIRFPTIGVEREFQQRERNLSNKQEKNGAQPRGQRLADVLRAHPHLVRSISFIQTIGSTPAYLLVPASTEIAQTMLDAVTAADHDDAWTLVIGRGGPMAEPGTCGGLMVQLVACDMFYGFRLAEFVDGLIDRVQHILDDRKIDREHFSKGARELFGRLVLSMENMGGQDSHRALNYLLVQHPGPYVALAERAGRAVLDNVETRLSVTAGARTHVAVILTFIDRTTGVPERLFTRIDVTEEWPFVADALNGGAMPLGLQPFVDGGWQGNSLGTAL